MKSIVPSQRNHPMKQRWQDKVIACFWLPFSLLFALWVYLTPNYEQKWGLPSPRSRRQPSKPLAPSFFVSVFVATIVYSATLFAYLALPVCTSRLLLILAIGVGFRQYVRQQNS